MCASQVLTAKNVVLSYNGLGTNVVVSSKYIKLNRQKLYSTPNAKHRENKGIISPQSTQLLQLRLPTEGQNSERPVLNTRQLNFFLKIDKTSTQITNSSNQTPVVVVHSQPIIISSINKSIIAPTTLIINCRKLSSLHFFQTQRYDMTFNALCLSFHPNAQTASERQIEPRREPRQSS